MNFTNKGLAVCALCGAVAAAPLMPHVCEPRAGELAYACALEGPEILHIDNESGPQAPKSLRYAPAAFTTSASAVTSLSDWTNYMSVIRR